MKFILTCTKYDKSLPLKGTVIDLSTIEELLEFIKAYGDVVISSGSDLYDLTRHFEDNGELQGWADEDDLECFHLVSSLPPNWKQLPSIEIYNGYRE